VIRKHSAFPLLDLQKLLRWSLFNLLVGNADGHGKNLSLLYQRDGTASLAPFYDLVCTRNYKNLAREMAMSLGGQWDPDLVSIKNLEGFASDFAIRVKLVSEEMQELSERMLVALPAVIANFRDLYGESPVLERLPIVIRKIVRRVNTQWKRSS
jgi:serine/threonine-protein kinase HipA